MSKEEKNTGKEKKGFFSRLVEKLDRKLEDKAKKSSCCGSESDKNKGSSCC